MKVSFEKIQEGLELSFDESAGWLSAIANRLGERESEGPVHVEIHLSASGRTVVLRGKGTATVENPCARCLKKVETHVAPEFDIALIPATHELDEDADETELAESDLEEYTYNGKEIDVAEILNEQFTLAQPYRVLCTDDCKGLCPDCGADLNQKECDCKKGSGHPAFAALADFKVEE